MRKYIIIEIGCIECGCPSGIVGIFDDEKAAKEIAEKCQERYDWHTGGQNSFEVFELPSLINSVVDNYHDYENPKPANE